MTERSRFMAPEFRKEWGQFDQLADEIDQVVACAVSFYAHVFFDKEYHVEGSRLQRFAWFRRKQELHFVHHRHANSNFAVIHFFWDRILGTYRRPDAGQTHANGTLRTGRPGR